MKLLAFAVYDTKAEAWSPPLFMRAIGEALRNFEDNCKDTSTPLGQHPGDFNLYLIGSYDQSSGNLTGHDPISHGNGLEYVRSLNPVD